MSFGTADSEEVTALASSMGSLPFSFVGVARTTTRAPRERLRADNFGQHDDGARSARFTRIENGMFFSRPALPARVACPPVSGVYVRRTRRLGAGLRSEHRSAQECFPDQPPCTLRPLLRIDA
jgi:hypothetical protein